MCWTTRRGRKYVLGPTSHPDVASCTRGNGITPAWIASAAAAPRPPRATARQKVLKPSQAGIIYSDEPETTSMTLLLGAHGGALNAPHTPDSIHRAHISHITHPDTWHWDAVRDRRDRAWRPHHADAQGLISVECALSTKSHLVPWDVLRVDEPERRLAPNVFRELSIHVLLLRPGN
jgi:hypothetical protein